MSDVPLPSGPDSEAQPTRTTRLGDGREVSSEELATLVYEDLRAMAAAFFGRGAGQTLQPTALVHEAYLRLADQSHRDWQNRGQFLAVAARMMRRVLVDAFRARGALKRVDDAQRVTLSDALPDGAAVELDPLDLEAALERLAGVKDRYVQIVELRFFAGLTVEETGKVLELSERQIWKDWNKARSYLAVYLGWDAEA